MKGALLLYGQVRTYKQCVSFLKKNLLDLNDLDIFMSTHRDDIFNENVSFEDLRKEYGPNLKQVSFLEDIDNSKFINDFWVKIKFVDPDLYSKYEEQFKNIKTIQELRRCMKINKLRYLNNKKGYQYLFHEFFIPYHRLNSLKICEEYQKNNNVKYDYIIIFRPDLIFLNKLYVDRLHLEKNGIFYRIDYFVVSKYDNIKKFINEFYDKYYYINEMYNCSIALDKKSNYLVETQSLTYFINNFAKQYNILNSLMFEITYILQTENIKAYTKNVSQEEFDSIIEKYAKK